MKLNPDCIRDILIYVEENTDLMNSVYLSNEEAESIFPKYSSDEVLYHIKQCELSGFFQGVSQDMSGGFDICYLSPAGHQFLSDIRSDNLWNNVKEVSKKVGSNSLSSLTQIATGVVTALIKSQLGIT